MRRRWGVIRSFFTYLEQQGAISSNPTLSIRAVPKEHIYLNLPFTDRQYNDILNYAAVADPGPTGDSKVYRARLHIFELLRWTGMDIGDAIQFRPSMIDADGVLRYIRTKTGIQAVIPLEPHMIELLHPAELCARCKQHALAEERRAAMPQTEPSTPAEPEEVEVKKIPIVDRERAKKLAQNFRLENCCALLKRPTIDERQSKSSRKEHRSMQLLEASGYACTRAAASLGVFDIVAIGPTEVVLCQVKSRDWPGTVEMEAIRNFVCPPFCRKDIHRFRDGQRLRDIKVV